MKRLSCYVENYESFGLFVGAFCASKNDPRKFRRRADFFNEFVGELEAFIETYEYNKNSIERWFNR